MKHLLALGPLPPPLTGTPVSFEIFCEQANQLSENGSLLVVDSSPKYLKQQKKFVVSFGNIKQALSILYRFAQGLRKADSAIIFASNGYIVTLGPLLLLIARIYNKDCYYRAFGGSLDNYVSNLNTPLKQIALKTLNSFSGLVVETELLQNHFSNLLKNTPVHYIPGYRPITEEDKPPIVNAENSTLKLAFVGIVKEEKGILVLLGAMKTLQTKGVNVELTIYGSIHEPIKKEFMQHISELPNTKYGGVLDWREVISTLRLHHLFVLPTFYQSEGHPGVLIEAMMAGIPVISTNFRSIPEIIKHEYNGLLVPPKKVRELSEAIEKLDADRKLLKFLGDNNALESRKFNAEILVADILEIATMGKSQ